MRHGNDMNSILAMPKDDLERKLLHGTRLVSIVNASKPFRGGRNLGDRGFYGDAEIASGCGAVLRIPVR